MILKPRNKRCFRWKTPKGHPAKRLPTHKKAKPLVLGTSPPGVSLLGSSILARACIDSCFTAPTKMVLGARYQPPACIWRCCSSCRFWFSSCSLNLGRCEPKADPGLSVVRSANSYLQIDLKPKNLQTPGEMASSDAQMDSGVDQAHTSF